MATTIWLVRHGETGSNAERVFQGHLDTELNARGEAQARELGRWFAGHHFDGVYASDLQRAARTAELIVAGRYPIALDADLREMHYGVLQGIPYQRAAEALEAHGLDEAWRRGDLQRSGRAIPGGESLRRFRGRSTRFVERLDALHPPELQHDVLVVAHGGKLASLLTVLLDLPARTRWSFRFANCGITRLTRERERTTLDFHNHVVWDDEGTTPRARFGPPPDGGEAHRPRS